MGGRAEDFFLLPTPERPPFLPDQNDSPVHEERAEHEPLREQLSLIMFLSGLRKKRSLCSSTLPSLAVLKRSSAEYG